MNHPIISSSRARWWMPPLAMRVMVLCYVLSMVIGALSVIIPHWGILKEVYLMYAMTEVDNLKPDEPPRLTVSPVGTNSPLVPKNQKPTSGVDDSGDRQVKLASPATGGKSLKHKK